MYIKILTTHKPITNSHQIPITYLFFCTSYIHNNVTNISRKRACYIHNNVTTCGKTDVMYIKILTTHKPKISTTYLASCYIHNNVTNIPQERLIGLDRHNTYIASSLSKNIDHIPLHVFQKISTNWCSIIQKYGQLTNGTFLWTLHVFQKDWQIDAALFENIDNLQQCHWYPMYSKQKTSPRKTYDLTFLVSNHLPLQSIELLNPFLCM